MFRSFALVILITGAFANEYYKGDTLVREGVYAFYNYEFDEAVNILSDARDEFPDHPGVHLIWAQRVKSQVLMLLNERAYHLAPHTYVDSMIDFQVPVH